MATSNRTERKFQFRSVTFHRLHSVPFRRKGQTIQVPKMQKISAPRAESMNIILIMNSYLTRTQTSSLRTSIS
uniref:Uncharacterized protein n=1 Tax=Romanomermis culicivorax TaxID=13658 RepID=A0A915IN89_ROMCU